MRLILFITMLLICLRMNSQQKSGLQLTFNHLALSVKNLDSSAAFYAEVLNLKEISRESRSEGVRWFSLGEGKELHLISEQYYKGKSVFTNKAVHMALTTTHFQQLLDILDSQNINYGDWDGVVKKVNLRSDGVRQIFFQDPDGYWIEVNSVADVSATIN